MRSSMVSTNTARATPMAWNHTPMPTDTTISNPARTSAGILGFGLLALGGLSLLCMSVGASGSAWNSPTVYTKGLFVLGGTLTVLGLLPLMLSRVLAATAACGAVVAAQLMGAGIVAFQHWLPASGISSFAFSSYSLVRSLAVVLALAGAAATVGCIHVLLRRGAFSATALPLVSRRCVTGIGVAVIIAVPPLLGFGSESSLDVSSLGAAVLLYSLPMGAGLIMAGWLRRTPALAALATVAASAVLAMIGKQMMYVPNPGLTFSLVLVAAFAVLLVRWTEADGGSARRR